MEEGRKQLVVTPEAVDRAFDRLGDAFRGIIWRLALAAAIMMLIVGVVAAIRSVFG